MTGSILNHTWREKLKRTAPGMLAFAAAVMALGALLAATDHLGFSNAGWLAYSVVFALGGGIVLLAWRWAGAQNASRWLSIALIVAISLRLVVSVGLTHLLPRFGYDKPERKQSFIYTDAYLRDRAAWALAVSGAPLETALEKRNQGDQYGGMALLYASAYRLFKPAGHRPLLMVALGFPFSALLVLFTWAFTRSVFGSAASKLATWVAVLFPDAVLLGSSQMREPYLGAALAMALFGYALVKRKRLKQGLVTIAVGTLVIALPLSPPFSLAILLAILLAWAWEGLRLGIPGWLAVVSLFAAAVVALFMMVNALSTAMGISGSPLEVLVSWWLTTSDSWQMYEFALQSEWIRILFRGTPDWSHLPLVVFYGLLRPFLPAGIVDQGAPIWRAIAIWRGLGWWMLMPFLVYASLAVFKSEGFRRLPTYLVLLIWVVALASSYRGVGDQWDNPRYRTIFLPAQAALAGWAFVSAREKGDPWLGRVAAAVVGALALFTAWYNWRYELLPTIGVVDAVLIVGGLLLLYLAGSFIYDVLRSRKIEP